MTEFAKTARVDGGLGDAAAIIEEVSRLHDFQILDANVAGSPIAIVPEGKRIEVLRPILDQYLTKPRRRRGKIALRDVDSFILMIERFKSADSVVFASPDRSSPSLTAVFDYNPKGDDATKADWGEHRAVYAPQLSDEWKAWSAKNGQFMSQADFAAFIEDRVRDLIVPNLDDPKIKTFADLVEGTWASPSDMVKLSRSLEVNVDATVKNAQTLSSGEISIKYEEVHTDGSGAPLKVPTLFTICIPVFYNGVAYRIPARLRYRVGGGKITWWYQLVQPELAFDDAFTEITEKVASLADIPVVLGTPEA